MAAVEEIAGHYGNLDRLLHRLAFAGRFVQATAADVERAVWGARYDQVCVAKPIFISSLPRAGTTLLLETLNRCPTLASQCYRDMPFILAPILWAHLSAPFQRTKIPEERAHGDGVKIGYDSPEAFEEVLWMLFWEEKYGEQEILLWTADDSKMEATRCFFEHMRKIIYLRATTENEGGRYISKNNANIARIPLLNEMFPDGHVLVLFRDPLAHAASMLNQHCGFLRVQERERFVERYMADIGHFEFGRLHRPIAFPGFRDLVGDAKLTSVDYWLAYWIAAFGNLLEKRDLITFVSYERLCSEGVGGLSRLCRVVGVSEREFVLDGAEFLRAPRPFVQPREGPSNFLRERALRIFEQLLQVDCLSPFGGD